MHYKSKAEYETEAESFRENIRLLVEERKMLTRDAKVLTKKINRQVEKLGKVAAESEQAWFASLISIVKEEI